MIIPITLSPRRNFPSFNGETVSIVRSSGQQELDDENETFDEFRDCGKGSEDPSCVGSPPTLSNMIKLVLLFGSRTVANIDSCLLALDLDVVIE